MDKLVLDMMEKLGAIAPILQIGFVAVIIIITVMTYAKWLSQKFLSAQQISSAPASNQSAPQHQQAEVSFMYFQGWFKSVLDGLAELRNNQEVNRLQLRETFGDELRKTRHDLKASFASVQAEIMSKLDEIEVEQKRIIELVETKRHR